jgi:hypothetical protein
MIDTAHDPAFVTSTPASTSYPVNVPYDPHLSQYHPSQSGRQAVPHDVHLQTEQPQHGNTDFSSTIHDTEVHDASRSIYEAASERPPSQDYSGSTDRIGATHYPPFLGAVADDPEAVLGGRTVRSPDPQLSMSPSEDQASPQEQSEFVHDGVILDASLGGFGNDTSMPMKSSSDAHVHDPYSPNNLNGDAMSSSGVNTATSSKTRLPSLPNGTSGTRSYSPVKSNSVESGDGRDRSNSLAYPTVSFDTKSLYAPLPPQHRRHVASEPSDGRRSNFKGPAKPHNQALGQELLVGSMTQMPYAPSPSLLGLNDPLGRTAARVPVFSFGFGGKLVTCFHGSSALNTGFDVALASRRSMDVNIRVLNRIIPESALDTSTIAFPGPLFADPGTPTASLVRPGAAAQLKTKKARVSQYLLDRTEEFVRGIGYLQPGSEDRRRLEGKLVLIKLLKVMVDNEGRLSGS